MAFVKRHWSILFLAFIPLIPLWRAVFIGEAIGPFDQIRQFAPWFGPKPTDAWDVLQADGVLQFYVWRDLVFESWRNFQVPFWNPYQLMGTPLLANSQSGALYPPHILMGILHVPTPLAITLLAWFHLFWAGLGVSKMVRALGGSEVGGAVAGASFALSPFMLSWTALSSVITTVAWIPWCLWALVELFGLPTPGQSLEEFDRDYMIRRRGQWKATWRLALFLGMMILGGHLQFVAYAGFGIVAMTIMLSVIRWRTLLEMAKEEGKPRSAARKSIPAEGSVLVAVVLGGLIALPQLLPVLKHSADSHRRNVPTEAGYTSYISSAIRPFEFANLVTPKALGDPRAPVEVGKGMTVAEYWPPLAKQGANFAESAVTIGPLVLGLMFLVPWRDRRTWPIATIGVLALLLAMGTVLNKLLYFGLPGWSSTGSPGRILVLFVLAACVLAGLAIGQRSQRQVMIAAVIAAAISLLVTIGLPGLKPAWQTGMDAIGDRVLTVASAMAFPMSLLVALLCGLVLLLKANDTKAGEMQPVSLLPGVTAALVALPLVGHLNLIPTGKPLAPIAGPEDRNARVAIINQNWGIIAAAKEALIPPNLAALSRIREIAGYDSLLNKDTKRILDDINQQDSAPPANGNIMFAKPTAYWETLTDAGVYEVWSAMPLDLEGDFPMRQEGGMFKYRLKHLDQDISRASVGSNPAKFIADAGNGMTLEATGPGELLIADRNLPGWSATVDGRPASIEPGDFITVELPQGKHQIELRYVAPGFITGLILGIPALLLALSGLAYSKRPGSKNDRSVQELMQ